MNAVFDVQYIAGDGVFDIQYIAAGGGSFRPHWAMRRSNLIGAGI